MKTSLLDPNSQLKLLFGHDPKRSNNFNIDFAHITVDRYKQQQVHFWGADTEHLYNENLRKLPKDHKWRIWENKTLTYTVNRQNYRCKNWDEIDWTNSILIFGCSNVFGVGLDDTETISSNITNILNIPVINLGVSGSSAMFSWVNTTKICKAGIQPKAVVYVWTYPERVTVLGSDNLVINSGPWNSVHEPLSRGWIFHPSHSIEYLKYLVDSCNQQWSCKSYHFTLCEKTASILPELGYLETIDLARDRQHIGIDTAKHWASTISSHITND